MHNLFANSLFTIRRGQSTSSRGLSPRLWSRVNGQSLSPDGFANGCFIGDDFKCFGKTTAVSSNIGRYNSEGVQYYSYEGTGDAIAQLATERDGVIKITGAATNNNETWLQPGDSASVIGCIDTTAGYSKLLIFEARIKFGQVTTTSNYFIGLSEENLAAAGTAADTGGALADKDYIGFVVNETDSSSLKFKWNKAGGGGAVTLLTYGTALVADTWYKLGFVYDPDAPADKRIKVFVNNTEQSTYGTNTQVTAATFPNGEELNMLYGQKNNNAAISTQMDWWGFYQQSV